LVSIEFRVAALTKGLGMAEVVHAKVVAEARFRVVMKTEVLIIGADVSAIAALTTLAALAHALLRSNRSLCKRLKSPISSNIYYMIFCFVISIILLYTSLACQTSERGCYIFITLFLF